MTHLAASITADVDRDIEDLRRRAESAVAGGARLIEWRLDALASAPGGVETAVALMRRTSAPVIATCRSAAEGGAFRGTESDRASLYEALIADDHPPRYIDLELSAWKGSGELRRRVGKALEAGRRERDVHTSLILSAHDFEGRPRDLLQRVEAMTAEPACDVIKVTWHARSIRDNLEALDLLAERRKPMIALCMGRFGLLSRVLAPKYGGLLVYAAAVAGDETAPGQPTVRELREQYRFGSIGPHTAVYGILGWPVEHSLSPALHNAGFAAIDHDGVYVPLPVAPGFEPFKATAMALIDHERLGFRGASVTVPHKEHVVRLAGEAGWAVDAPAARLGAANTIALDAGGVACLNTDAPAALASLRAAGVEVADRQVAIVGAGGVARAIAWALADAGAKVVLFNRTEPRARTLAHALHGQPTAAGGAAHVVVGKRDALSCGCFDVIVNCTSVGMEGGPAPDASPVPADVPMGPGVTVMDTVYAPHRTPLLAHAEAAGARTIGGLDMLRRQAALQFERWTGTAVPAGVFERASG